MKKLWLGLVLTFSGITGWSATSLFLDTNSSGQLILKANGLCDSQTFSIMVDTETYFSNNGKKFWSIGNDCSINMALSRKYFDGRNLIKVYTYRKNNQNVMHIFSGTLSRSGFVRHLELREAHPYEKPQVSFSRSNTGQIIIRGKRLCDSDFFRIRIVEDRKSDDDEKSWYRSSNGKTAWEIGNCSIEPFTLNRDVSDKLKYTNSKIEVRTYNESRKKNHTFEYRVRSTYEVNLIKAGGEIILELNND